MTARALALGVLDRIDGGAYANLALSPALDRSGLAPADRRFATDLVYGTTRMRRACDSAIDRFVVSPPQSSRRSAVPLIQASVSSVARSSAGAQREAASSPAAVRSASHSLSLIHI